MATYNNKQKDPIKNLTLIDDLVMEGVQQQFKKAFSALTLWTTGDDGMKMVQRLYEDKSVKEKYPICLLSLESWNILEEKRNTRDSSMRGIKVAASTDSRSLLRSKILPIEYAVTVEFRTNSWDDIKSFARHWLFHSVTRQLNFQVDYGLTPVDVRVELAKTFTFPKRETSPEQVQEYVATNSLTIGNYINLPDLYSQDIIDAVEVSLEAPSTDGTSPNTQLWTFTSPRRV